MANIFKVKTSRDIGTVGEIVGTYTVAANTQVTAIGLVVSNKISNTINITAYHNDGVNDTVIVANATLPPGSSIIPIGGNQKIVLETGHGIKVSSSANNSVDAILSILEITE